MGEFRELATQHPLSRHHHIFTLSQHYEIQIEKFKETCPKSGPVDLCPRIFQDMFVLALVKQTVRVPAEKFDRDVDQAISEELNLKFANKVVKLKLFGH